MCAFARARQWVTEYLSKRKDIPYNNFKRGTQYEKHKNRIKLNARTYRIWTERNAAYVYVLLFAGRVFFRSVLFWTSSFRVMFFYFLFGTPYRRPNGPATGERKRTVRPNDGTKTFRTENYSPDREGENDEKNTFRA